MSIEPKRAYKIVLIGDPEVGKTSIRRKYMGKSFRADYLKTLGADFAAQKVNVEGELVLLTIWDLAGQSIFQGMRSSFYHGCKCALIVFDVTNPSSLENCLKWGEEAVRFAKNSLHKIYLIGNKIDLTDDVAITQEDVNKIVRQFNETIKFPVKTYETSALTGANINELFENMSKSLIIGEDTEEVAVKNDYVSQEDTVEVQAQAIEMGSKEKMTHIISLVDDLEKKMSEVNKALKEVKDSLDNM
ncbi:MAG: GTP-binding protein [Candidatus Heimdallarchaeota archaeon]|nr:GTP-binding protein [Candidatus Heimdallarchaeota archaeon]